MFFIAFRSSLFTCSHHDQSTMASFNWNFFKILFRNKTFEIFPFEIEHIHIGNKLLKAICNQRDRCFGQ